LIDPLPFKTTLMRKERFGIGRYAPLYVGEIKDTISLNYNNTSYAPPPPPPTLPEHLTGNLKNQNREKIHFDFFETINDQPELQINGKQHLGDLDSSVIKISVDTMTQITHLNFSHFQDQTFAFHSYPVLISNESSENSLIGFGEYIQMILEALDKDGQWKAIERNFRYGCGTGIDHMILRPENIAITSVPLFQGDFKTKLRLRHLYDSTLSNEFRGTIDTLQFYRKKN